jgi:hypothetical protein
MRICQTSFIFLILLCVAAFAQQKGTFTDVRDGKTYKTVKIVNQMWMAENLNYQTSSGSWCYTNCNKYDRLYNWKTAKTACPSGWHLPSREEWDILMRSAGGKRDSLAEYKAKEKLETVIKAADGQMKFELTKMRDSIHIWGLAGKTLKSTHGWNESDGKSGNGTDNFGFSAVPVGYRDVNGGFNNSGYVGNWWAGTEDGSGGAYYRIMSYNYEDVYELNNDVNSGFSVRCVQN